MLTVDRAQLRALYRQACSSSAESLAVVDVPEADVSALAHFRSLAGVAGGRTHLADALWLQLRLRRWAMRAVAPLARSMPTRNWLPVASMACSLVALLVALWSREPTEAPVYRSSEGFTESAAVAVYRDIPARLQWQRPAGVDQVQLHLFDHQLEPLWKSEWTTAESVEVPPTIRLQLRPDRTYYWRLRSNDGLREEWSALHRFRISVGGGSDQSEQQ